MKKLGVLINTSPAHGGTFQYGMGILQCLSTTQADVTVFFDYDSALPVIRRYAASHWRLEKYHGHDGSFTQVLRAAAVYGVPGLRRFARGRHALLRQVGVDQLFCPSASIAGWLCDVPYTVAIHDLWHRGKIQGTGRFREPFRDITTRRATENAHAVFVDSELGRRELHEAYSVNPGLVQVWPTGPAPFVWEAEQIPTVLPANIGPFVFYPGGFHPAKNQAVILRALARVNQGREKPFHAVFCGLMESPYAAEMRALARELGQEAQVHFLGTIGQEQMAGIYRRAFCHIMPSKIGPTNMPIYEAQALGCPVIASNIGQMPDQVGDAGLLFDPDRPEELAAQILRFAEDEPLRRGCIDRGLAKMRDFSPAVRGARLVQILFGHRAVSKP